VWVKLIKKLSEESFCEEIIIFDKNQAVKDILLVGNGNVAFHLKKVLRKAGYHISENSDEEDFDIVIFSISDDAYTGAIASFKHRNKIMVHTSGSVPATIFKGKTEKYGVIYPYQSISKNDKLLDFKKIPLLITASDEKTEKILVELSSTISDTVKIISDNQRMKLHLAAVFANNFTNHMIAIAQKLAHENNLDAALLQPLLEKTFLRLKHHLATDMQTGPAVRNDNTIIEKHLKLLEEYPAWQKIYSFVSESIKESKKINEKF